MIRRAPWLLPLSLCERWLWTEPASPIYLGALVEHQEAPPVVQIVGRAPQGPQTRSGHWPRTTGSPRLLLIYDEAIPVRWSPGAILFAQKYPSSPNTCTKTNQIVRGKLRIPPPNDESQTPSGAPVGPVHIAKVCGEATSYLFFLDATKLPWKIRCGAGTAPRSVTPCGCHRRDPK